MDRVLFVLIYELSHIYLIVFSYYYHINYHILIKPPLMLTLFLPVSVATLTAR